MQFWLGTHRASWLATANVDLFVSTRQLANRRTLPVAAAPWALDSGGFTELSMHGRWLTEPADYVDAISRYAEEIGRLEWAAPQDWMCEPFMVERTGLSVEEHQRRTVENVLLLRSLKPAVNVIPVLQGWEPDDYLRCVDWYTDAGIDVAAEPLVGLGSVCRRQATGEIGELVRVLARAGVRLHGFGMKVAAFTGTDVAANLVSADSMAWSYQGRRSPPLDGCAHKNCANCLRYALRWRAKLLRRLGHEQLALGVA